MKLILKCNIYGNSITFLKVAVSLLVPQYCCPSIFLPLIGLAFLNTNCIHWSSTIVPYPVYSQPWPRLLPLHSLCPTHLTPWCTYQSPPPSWFIFLCGGAQGHAGPAGVHINHTHVHARTHAHIGDIKHILANPCRLILRPNHAIPLMSQPR